MRETIARVAAAVTLIALTATNTHAAGARISWHESGDAEHFRLYVAQPDGQGPELSEFWIEDPNVAEDGTYYFDVHGIDPLRPALFLMVGVDWQGFRSQGSNVMELESDAFCATFDVDADGVVTSADALAVARKALGLRNDRIHFRASLATALDVLRLAMTFQCV